MNESPNSNATNPSVMSFIQPPSQLERRQRAAQLIEAVLDESIEPRIAINRWPESTDTPDLSLDCALMALWHFEADEAQQQSEVFYLDAQLDLLRQIARHLKAGRDLPPYFLRSYLPAAPIRFYYPRTAWEAGQQFIVQHWHWLKQTFELALTQLPQYRNASRR